MAGAPIAGSTGLVVVFIGSKSSITSISIQDLLVVVSRTLLPWTIPSCSTFSRLSSLDRMTGSTFSGVACLLDFRETFPFAAFRHGFIKYCGQKFNVVVMPYFWNASAIG